MDWDELIEVLDRRVREPFEGRVPIEVGNVAVKHGSYLWRVGCPDPYDMLIAITPSAPSMISPWALELEVEIWACVDLEGGTYHSQRTAKWSTTPETLAPERLLEAVGQSLQYFQHLQPTRLPRDAYRYGPAWEVEPTRGTSEAEETLLQAILGMRDDDAAFDEDSYDAAAEAAADVAENLRELDAAAKAAKEAKAAKDARRAAPETHEQPTSG
jgi:hypothetical protein